MGSAHFLVIEAERKKEEKRWKKTSNFAEHLDAKQPVSYSIETISFLTTILQNRPSSFQRRGNQERLISEVQERAASNYP